ncbi:glutamate-5-semialdehyde dehydrogenase [Bacillus sp. 1P06AnD]|uniref:glutamate-5-semialdehyde dehydrogenase n=1 Tax=Bacillus sp. 1P06AnD TaxID=3132208 RepID=UPI0039A12ECC
MTEIQTKGRLAKEASRIMLTLATSEKDEALRLIAHQLRTDTSHILQENIKDMEAGKRAGLSSSVLDRMLLTGQRIEAMAAALELLIDLKDPVGEILERIVKNNGLIIEKKRVPLGVIGMIYEARPNVTIDAASLALKTGNAIILKGSSSAYYSNLSLVDSIHRALEKSTIPAEAVQLLDDNSRESVKELFHCNEYLDVLIPRGGKNLIQTVLREATVPVLETGAGNCHLYIDGTAQCDMAIEVALNAKVQRPSVCNSIETILVHKSWLYKYGGRLIRNLSEEGVTIYGDAECMALGECILSASKEHWEKEFLGLEVAIKTVETIEEAIDHINRYGTRHSESIITENDDNADLFMALVDAAAVYHNASTRFTDGFEFGYGAEIGISTQKLHARGPMGLAALTSEKFFIQGNGQIRN